MREASAAAEEELAVVAAARAAAGSRPVVVEATPGARVRVRATGDALLEVATAARLAESPDEAAATGHQGHRN